MSAPTYTINILKVGHLEMEATYTAWRHHRPGVRTEAPCFAYLISGKNIPLMLVDTGIKESMADEVLARRNMKFIHDGDYSLDSQLAKFGYKREDVKVILHTNLQSTHSGNDDYFPQAKIIFPRKEIMWSVSGICECGEYPPEYIKYFVDQLHVPGRIRVIDDIAEIAPGIVLEPNEGHTWGSMLVKVNTTSGMAIMCGDVIVSIHDQCVSNGSFGSVAGHYNSCIDAFGDHTTPIMCNMWASKKTIQKVMREADIVLPTMDGTAYEKYGDTI